jgi:hypothetical protein
MTVKVPELVGLTVPEAREAGRVAGVVVTSSDLDGPPLAAQTWPGVWLVTAQLPLPGTRVHLGAVVVIEFEALPGAGDREPRQPPPLPDSSNGSAPE